VAGHYGDLIDGFVIDQQDRAQVNNLNCAVLASNTIMNEGPDRVRLAVEVLDFARQITN